MASTVVTTNLLPDLKPVKNSFATRQGNEFAYYRIKLGERRGNFVELLKGPPVMEVGYVTYDNQLYEVSIKSLFKGKVNVSNPYATTAADKSNAANSTSATGTGAGAATAGISDNNVKSTDVGRGTSTGSNKQGAGTEIGSEELESANMAWLEQARALLYSEDPEAFERLESCMESNSQS